MKHRTVDIISEHELTDEEREIERLEELEEEEAEESEADDDSGDSGDDDNDDGDDADSGDDSGGSVDPDADFSSDDVENITDEERAALSGDDDDESPSTESEKDESDEEGQADSGEEDAEDGEGTGSSEAEGDADDQGESEPDPKPADDPAPRAEDAAKPDPVEEVDPNKEALEAISTKRDELKQRYEDGEVDTVEFMDEREKLAKEENAIEWEARKQELAQEQAQKAAQDAWQSAQDSFLVENDDYAKSDILLGALQVSLNKVYTDPAFQGKSYSDQLEEAKRLTDAELGRVAKVEEEPKPADKAAEKAAKQKAMKGRGKADAPTSLSGVPPADESKATGDSPLDGLEGLALERALANMTEEQMDQYLEQSH